MRRKRLAARVLVFDTLDRLLLFRFTPPDRPPLWATPGGEVDGAETFADAAKRELFEETGFDIEPGPCIAERESDFVTFTGEPVHAVEQYFAVRTDQTAIHDDAHTDSEKSIMLGHRWWTVEEIEEATEQVFPPDLTAIARKVMGQ